MRTTPGDEMDLSDWDEIAEDRLMELVIYDLYRLGYRIDVLATLFRIPREYVISIVGTDE